jgi:adenylate cyclase
MKRKKAGFIIGLSVTFITLVLGFFTGLLVDIENKTIDWRFRFYQKQYKPSEIVIITVDEASIDRIGRWPWPRKTHARLVDFLSSCGARTILFDVLFVDADKIDPASDRALGDATGRAGNVLHEALRVPAVISLAQKDGTTQVMYGGFSIKNPIDPVLKKSAMIGFPNIQTDQDGLTRRLLPFVNEEGVEQDNPFIGLSGAAHYLGIKPDELLSRLGIDKGEPLLLNYLGPSNVFHGGKSYKMTTFTYFPYYHVFENTGDRKFREAFKDKIVLIGGTAPALFDIKITPFDSQCPGIEVVATSIYNFIHKNFIREIPNYVVLLLCLGFGLFSTIIFMRSTPITSGLVFLASVFCYFIFCWWLMIFSYKHVEFTMPAVILIFNYTFITLYRFITEEKEKRWIKKAFGQYLSPVVINEIIKNPDSLALGGKRQEMTVLFSDIRGFTTISESSTPEGVVALLNEYLTKMTEVVFRQEGTLDKFIGDAVMAFWNSPVPQADHAKRGVFCAIEMMEELDKLQAKWSSECKVLIDIGIGVNTGDMVVGNLGSIERMDYTVIGDNVNLASRLEGLNKEYKTHIIISDSTYQYVKDFIIARPLGAAKVKGKEKAVEIFAVEGRK